MGEYMTDLRQQFSNFSKFDDAKSDGKTLSLIQVDKWMKQANINDGKRITSTDIGLCFNQFKVKAITYHDFIKFIEDLAAQKNLDPDEVKENLVKCGLPTKTSLALKARNAP